MLRLGFTTFFVLAIVAGTALPTRAQQANTAVVVGTVLDSSDAAVPGATVALTHTDTSTTTTVVTDQKGQYRTAPLRTGSYNIAVELPGFKTHQTQHYLIHYNTSPAYAKWVGSLFEGLHKAFYNYWTRRGAVSRWKVGWERSSPGSRLTRRSRWRTGSSRRLHAPSTRSFRRRRLARGTRHGVAVR